MKASALASTGLRTLIVIVVNRALAVDDLSTVHAVLNPLTWLGRLAVRLLFGRLGRAVEWSYGRPKADPWEISTGLKALLS
jgi:hypothetical protein